jgi:hypothetical protein
MAISIYEKNTYQKHTRTGVAANSLDLTAGATFLKISGGFVAQATAPTDRIVGVNQTAALFASDNQTVAKATVDFVPKESDHYYLVAISGGTITQADEGKFYNLASANTVDGTTESTVPYYVDTTAGAAVDPVISMQLELVKFISATSSVFRIVNL